jgi:hypothetical protein
MQNISINMYNMHFYAENANKYAINMQVVK